VYGKPPTTTTTAVHGTQYPAQTSPRQVDVSPRQPTFAAATFQPNDAINGETQKAGSPAQVSKLQPPTVVETAGIVNGEPKKRDGMNGSGTGDGHVQKDHH
jgi:hypothetical protein